MCFQRYSSLGPPPDAIQFVSMRTTVLERYITEWMQRSGLNT